MVAAGAAAWMAAMLDDSDLVRVLSLTRSAALNAQTAGSMKQAVAFGTKPRSLPPTVRVTCLVVCGTNGIWSAATVAVVTADPVLAQADARKLRLSPPAKTTG